MCVTQKSSCKKGFTLMEMLAVVAIIVVIAAAALPLTLKTMRRLRQQELDSKARIIYIAAQNRITDMRSSGRQHIYLDTGKSKPIIGSTLRYVASYDGETDAAGIFGADLVDYETLQTNWVIVFDSLSGNIREVFYSEGDLGYDPETFDSYRDYNNRLNLSAEMGYYGGETVDISRTYSLSPKLNIENGERLIAHMSCESPDLSPLTFELTVADGSGSTATKTLIPTLFGGSYSCDLVLDSLKEGEHFKEKFPALTAGNDIVLELKVISDSKFVDDGVVSARANSLFAVLEGDTAVITCCRHLQNLDKEISGVGESVKKAVQKSSLFFGDTVSESDWFSTYGGAAFKPIYNPDITCYDGSYRSVKSVNEGGIDKLREEIAATVIYDINIQVSSSSNAGLFASLAPNQQLTLKNIYLCNANVKADYESAYDVSGCNAGALVGLMSDGGGSMPRLSIEGCRVYLDKTKSALKNEAYIDGSRVGGLIGSALGGKVYIKDSFAATVIGSGGKTYAGGGLIGLAANAETVIENSYADCYIYGQSIGGLVGSTFNAPPGAKLTLDSCYAAGYLKASSAGLPTDGSVLGAAGLVMGSVSGSEDTYTVCSIAVPEGGGYYTTFKSLSTDQSAVVNTYYLDKSLDNTHEDVMGTEQKSYTSLNERSNYGTLFSCAAFTGSNSGLKSNAYNLKKQGLGDYSYPRLTGLPHYGDWQADFETGALVYFEEYVDGSFGFWGANTDTLKDDTAIVGDGYAIVFADTAPTVPGVNISVDGGEGRFISFLTANRKIVTSIDGSENYVIYILPKDVCGGTAAVGSFYQKLRLDINGAIKYYYFNPQFAKCLTKGEENDTAPEAPNAIYIRTARHIFSLSQNYNNFAAETAASTFMQEADISYISYKWSDYCENGKPAQQAPIGSSDNTFNAYYNGGKHRIAIDISVHGEEYVGFFGCNSGSISDLLISFDGAKIKKIGELSAAVGSFVGENSGRIIGCLIEGADIEISAAASGSISIGGFAGRNTASGEITLSTAQVGRISAAANELSSIRAGGFVGENSGNAYESMALSCIDLSNSGGSAAAAGFAAANSGNIEGCYAASALMPRDYVEIIAFAFDMGGTVNNCRYLDGGFYRYCQTVCPYKYNADMSAQRISYEDLAAVNIGLMEDRTDGRRSFADWIEKPDLGRTGLFYWEECLGGYHISLIGSHDGEGIAKNDLCADPACRSVIRSGYGYYTDNSSSTDVSAYHAPADAALADKINTILGGSYSVYILNGGFNGSVEIIYSDDLDSFGYSFEADDRFADLFRYVKMSVMRSADRYLDIIPTAEEIAAYGGRNSSFFDLGYQIRTLEQLGNVAEEPAGSFKVSHNIYGGNAPFTPIGSETAFSGAFDGGDFIIRGLNISSQQYNAGLFGRTENALISNIILIESSCDSVSSASIGSIAGSANGGSIINCCGGLQVSAPMGGVTFGGILGSGNASVSGCTSISRMVSGAGSQGIGFGSGYYAVSGGSGAVSDCYALDILCTDAGDYMSGGITFLSWSDMQSRLKAIPSDYPAGAVYWHEQSSIITDKIWEPSYITVNTYGDTTAYRFKLISVGGQEVMGVIVEPVPGAVSVTLTPAFEHMMGEYKLIAFTDDGAASQCGLAILPDTAG